MRERERKRERERESERKRDRRGTLNTFFTAKRGRDGLITHLATSRETSMTTAHNTRGLYARACLCARAKVATMTIMWASERKRERGVFVRSFDYSRSFLTYLDIFFTFPERYFLFLFLSWSLKNRGYSSFLLFDICFPHVLFRESKHKKRNK